MLRAISNHVIFVFEDKFVRRAVDGASDGQREERHFQEETKWGFQFSGTKDSMDKARWAIVLATGPDCHKDIQKGMRVLIEPLKWTNGVQMGKDWFWRTNDEWVLAIDDDFNLEKAAAG